MKYFNSKNRQAFTLPELLVATGIFLIILSITMANLRQGNQTSELRLKALEVANDIRRVQNNALVALPLANGTIPDHWGIHFVSSSPQYIIFAETAGSPNYNFMYNAGEAVQTITLPNKFIISAMNDPETLNCSGKIWANNMDIVFTVPAGQIFFNGVQPLSAWETGACGDYNPGWVNLKYLPTGQSINIEINWISGKITTTDIIN